jgi:hypothetical protein
LPLDIRTGTTNIPDIRTELAEPSSGSNVIWSTIAYIPILTFLAMTELGGSKRKKAEAATRRKTGFMEPPKSSQPMLFIQRKQSQLAMARARVHPLPFSRAQLAPAAPVPRQDSECNVTWDLLELRWVRTNVGSDNGILYRLAKKKNLRRLSGALAYPN